MHRHTVVCMPTHTWVWSQPGTGGLGRYPRSNLTSSDLSWSPSCTQITCSYPQLPDNDLWPWSDSKVDKERQHETDNTNTFSASYPIFPKFSHIHIFIFTQTTWLLRCIQCVVNDSKNCKSVFYKVQLCTVTLGVHRQVIRPRHRRGDREMRGPWLKLAERQESTAICGSFHFWGFYVFVKKRNVCLELVFLLQFYFF